MDIKDISKEELVELLLNRVAYLRGRVGEQYTISVISSIKRIETILSELKERFGINES